MKSNRKVCILGFIFVMAAALSLTLPIHVLAAENQEAEAEEEIVLKVVGEKIAEEITVIQIEEAVPEVKEVPEEEEKEEAEPSEEQAADEDKASEDEKVIKATVKDEEALGEKKTEETKASENEKAASETTKAKTAAKTTAAKKETKTTAAKTTAKASYSAADLKLLSCIIFAEAGNQSYRGKLAVGNVVMNRVKSKLFPNTISGVVYQSGYSRAYGRTIYQFSPVGDGALARALANYGHRTNPIEKAAEEDCIKAAKAALAGIKATTADYLFFCVYNNWTATNHPYGEIIGAHYFYNY